MRRMRRGLAVPAFVLAAVLVAAGCTGGGGGGETSKPLVIGASLPGTGDFAQPGTASHQADLFAQYVAGLPTDRRPETAAYPAQDDPFAAPVIESVRKQLETIGIKTVYNKLYSAETSNFDGIAGDIKAASPDLIVQGAVFEDGVWLVRS